MEIALKVLVTGAAGFIGMNCALRLLDRGDEVIGVDNLNEYYDVSLKQARLSMLQQCVKFQFHKIDIADRAPMTDLFAAEKPDRVIHLAAQAGVRYSLKIRMPISTLISVGLRMFWRVVGTIDCSSRLCQLIVGLWRE